MTPRAPLPLLGLILVLVAAPIAGAAVPLGAGPTAPSQDAPATDPVQPGTRLAGVVAAENASINGALDRSSFQVRFDRSETDNARAAVVAAESGAIERQLEKLRERQDSLVAAHENGALPEPAYVARAAALAARIDALEARANATASAAESLPSDVLEANGINVTAIRTLQTDARNMTGEQVATIARTIAGDRGQGQQQQNGDGPDQSLAASLDRTANRIDRLSDRVNATSSNALNETEIATAQDLLDQARSDLEEARSLADTDPEQARTVRESAETHLDELAAMLNNSSGPPDDTPGNSPS